MRELVSDNRRVLAFPVGAVEVHRSIATLTADSYGAADSAGKIDVQNAPEEEALKFLPGGCWREREVEGIRLGKASQLIHHKPTIGGGARAINRNGATKRISACRDAR